MVDAALHQMLADLNLGGYEGSLVDEGYDDFCVLSLMRSEKLINILVDDIGMAEGEAKAFFASVQAALSNVRRR